MTVVTIIYNGADAMIAEVCLAEFKLLLARMV